MNVRDSVWQVSQPCQVGLTDHHFIRKPRGGTVDSVIKCFLKQGKLSTYAAHCVLSWKPVWHRVTPLYLLPSPSPAPVPHHRSLLSSLIFCHSLLVISALGRIYFASLGQFITYKFIRYVSKLFQGCPWQKFSWLCEFCDTIWRQRIFSKEPFFLQENKNM